MIRKDLPAMDSAAQRPSGNPRVSRLPVLNKRSSQVFPKVPDAEISKAPNDKPQLQKRTSIACLPRSTPSGLKDTTAIATPAGPRASLPNGAGKVSKHLSLPRPGASRASSRSSQQRLPQPSAKHIRGEDEENNDQLGSLGNFPSASRQDSHEQHSPTEHQDEAIRDDGLYGLRNYPKSRSSLSDRTVESLQNIPTTPKDRRRSNFFMSVESPMGPPPRPGSSLSRTGSSNSSRPGTSDGVSARPPSRQASLPKKTSSSDKSTSRRSLGGFGFTSAKARSASTTLNAKSHSDGNDGGQTPSRSLHLSKDLTHVGPPSVKKVTGSKTLTARPLKAKPSLTNAFTPLVESKKLQPKSPAPRRAVSGSTNASSTALREQIAAARAAAKTQKLRQDSPQQGGSVVFPLFDPNLHADPFNQAPKNEQHILRNRIKAALTDGKLNVAALGLKKIPDEILHMYESDAMEDAGINWAEVVDLTKLIAADNELENLGDSIFPDISAEELAGGEDSQGNQFGGLETLDLHGNHLQALPQGLRRLERLAVLNLTHNKLEISSLDTISQILTLKDLRLGHNNLSGNLPTCLCGLVNLETLDLQANRLLGLPEALRELVSLRVLNVSSNQLTALPMEAIQKLSLIELDASNNALLGSLFPLGVVSAHSTLRYLHVANNSLAALTFSESLSLPQIRTLDITNNHLTSLPPISDWTELITLRASDNKIAELPPGFAKLQKLRNVNFTSNELRMLDPEISRMESLESLILASNPLRDKKYLTSSADDIKRDLKTRLISDSDDLDDGAVSDPETVIGPDTAPTSRWTLKSGGSLDLSLKGLSDDVNDILGSFLKYNVVKQLILRSNNLSVVPPVLWLGHNVRVLDISDNAFGKECIFTDLELPALQELHMSRCRLTSLDPLISKLSAPCLQHLDVSGNRLSGTFPTLRNKFSALVTLIASDNKFTSVSVDSLRGLKAVNLKSNDLQQLPAEIGLLWDEGLRSLEVGSNGFRVPSHRVLEKGWEATSRWLRDRLPGDPGSQRLCQIDRDAVTELG